GQADGLVYTPPSRAGGSSWFRTGLRRVAVAIADVRTHLEGGTPVLLGLTVFDTFFRPDPGGHIADPPSGASGRGRHAVLAVGHQADELLIRNSWGTTWALGGYAWISAAYIRTHTGDAWIIDSTKSSSAAAAGRSHKGESEEGTYGTR
ncbi:MAG: C1 family peptidase, partial [Mycobacteriales bacterium]